MPPMPLPPPRHVAGPVAALLQAAKEAELRARGPDRRAAFRLTRTLLGGARTAGHTAAQLAECLDQSANAVRDRGGSDGWVRAAPVAALAGLTEAQLARWHQAGLLTQRCQDSLGDECYLASELIRALSSDRETDSVPGPA